MKQHQNIRRLQISSIWISWIHWQFHFLIIGVPRKWRATPWSLGKLQLIVNDTDAVSATVAVPYKANDPRQQGNGEPMLNCCFGFI